MIIAVSGTPGTGKTTLAKNLAKKLKFFYLDVNLFIKQHKLRGSFLKKFKSYEVDVVSLNKLLLKFLKTKKNVIIDSHLSHYLPASLLDYCVLCTCELPVLKKRLKIRKYSETKIRENLDAEIFHVCLVEALERKHHLFIVDTSTKSVHQCVKDLLNKIK